MDESATLRKERRLELEQKFFEISIELGKLKNECQHEVIAKGRLIYSPRQGKVVQTFELRPQSNQDVINNGRCKDVLSVYAYCQICDKEFGWWCPVNPKGYCEYKTGLWDDDNCIHCHQPMERK